MTITNEMRQTIVNSFVATKNAVAKEKVNGVQITSCMQTDFSFSFGEEVFNAFFSTLVKGDKKDAEVKKASELKKKAVKATQNRIYEPTTDQRELAFKYHVGVTSYLINKLVTPSADDMYTLRLLVRLSNSLTKDQFAEYIKTVFNSGIGIINAPLDKVKKVKAVEPDVLMAYVNARLALIESMLGITAVVKGSAKSESDDTPISDDLFKSTGKGERTRRGKNASTPPKVEMPELTEEEKAEFIRMFEEKKAADKQKAEDKKAADIKAADNAKEKAIKGNAPKVNRGKGKNGKK